MAVEAQLLIDRAKAVQSSFRNLILFCLLLGYLSIPTIDAARDHKAALTETDLLASAIPKLRELHRSELNLSYAEAGTFAIIDEALDGIALNDDAFVGLQTQFSFPIYEGE